MDAASRIILELEGDSKTFEQGEIAIGRDKDNDFVVASMSVSRRHCRLRIDGGDLRCLDVSRGGVLQRLGLVDKALPPGEWTTVTLDERGHATLVLGDIALEVTCAPAEAVSPVDPPFKTMALPSKERPPAAGPPAAGPARGGPARAGESHKLLEALVADGKVRLDVGDEGFQRLVDLTLIFGEFVVAARKVLETTYHDRGLENPLSDIGEHVDGSAFVRSFVAGRTGRRALTSALELLVRRDAALLAGFERGVKDLFDALDPASGTHGSRGLLGIIDSSLQKYVVFFHKLAEEDWRGVVFGPGFIDGALSRLHQEGEGDE